MCLNGHSLCTEAWEGRVASWWRWLSHYAQLLALPHVRALKMALGGRHPSARLPLPCQINLYFVLFTGSLIGLLRTGGPA